MSKQCFKCGEVKPLSEFYRHPAMGDGHLGKCKECAKADVRKRRQDNGEYYRAYDRKRGNRLPLGHAKQYRMENPEKYAAHTAINIALRDGSLTKAEYCQVCESTFAVEAHHHDYARPLDVWWLCAACHKRLHAIQRRCCSRSSCRSVRM